MLSARDIFYILGCALLLFFYIPIKIDDAKLSLETEFENYLHKFNKSYGNSTEYQLRLQIFQESLAIIETLNAARNESDSAIYGLTNFSDLTPQEFAKIHFQHEMYGRVSTRKLKLRSRQIYENKTRIFKRTTSNIPSKVDWREKNVIGPIAIQKQCGACWALTVIANIESMSAIRTGKFEKFSVQQLIDCIYADGCDGGDMCTALRLLKMSKIKVQYESAYPFIYKKGLCRIDQNAPGIRVVDYSCENLSENEEDILETLATFGPVGVAINAYTWQHYLGGIIMYNCDSSMAYLNHAVQIVGYDLTATIPYYIIKNSWGESFGNNGYLYIAIGKNICGLANEVSAVQVL